MTGALFAQQPTYIDWGAINYGGSIQGVAFYVDVYWDTDLFIHYLFDWDPQGGAWGVDWPYQVNDWYYHTLRIVVDPDNRVAESNENNNVWQGTFLWSPATACQPEANQIVLYEHTWYMGRCLMLTVDTPDLLPYDFDDIASSIHFGSLGALQTRLYELYNYDGVYSGFTGDYPDFNYLNFNDLASSVRFGVSREGEDDSTFDSYLFDTTMPMLVMPTVTTESALQSEYPNRDAQHGRSGGAESRMPVRNVPGDFACAYNSGPHTLTCSLASLAPNSGWRTITLNTTVNAGAVGVLTNIVTVGSSQPDPNVANNQSIVTVNIVTPTPTPTATPTPTGPHLAPLRLQPTAPPALSNRPRSLPIDAPWSQRPPSYFYPGVHR